MSEMTNPEEAAGDIHEALVTFVDDDLGYLRWTAAHPKGFVVNAERRPRAAYLILHRASCRSVIGSPARGLHWTLDYIKICARHLQPLDTWAAKVGGRLQHCRLCQP